MNIIPIIEKIKCENKYIKRTSFKFNSKKYIPMIIDIACIHANPKDIIINFDLLKVHFKRFCEKFINNNKGICIIIICR